MLPARFYAKIRKTAGGCHVWRAATNEKGYPRYWHAGKPRKAHIVAWTDANGPIPAGLTLHHTCTNTRCVNPAHLELSTRADNTAEGNRRRALASIRCVGAKPNNEGDESANNGDGPAPTHRA